MTDLPRIYLDNAATSFPKPSAVYDAVDRYSRDCGAAVGRGAYRQSTEVTSIVRQCRKQAVDLFHGGGVERMVFTFNGTDSLNLALHGLLAEGDHVVTSTIEHNSVLRPLRWLSANRGVEVSYVEPGAEGIVDAATLRERIRPQTKLVALVHASNVTGALQPVADVGEICRQAGVLFLVDAAQTAGHLPINLQELPIDLLACPGHKGLLGPLGTGLLWLRPGVEDQLKSVRQGGTGSQSEQEEQPDTLPDKYESGNHNAPGLAGLRAGLAYLQDRGIDDIHRHEQSLTARLIDGLRPLDMVTVHGPTELKQQVGVVSVAVDGWEPQILAGVLDENFGVQTRAGLHCAPGAHRHLGTIEQGGTIRFSVGPFTTEQDIDAAIEVLREITST